MPTIRARAGSVGVPFVVQDAPLTITALYPPDAMQAGSGGGLIRLATFKDANTNPDITDYSATVNWGDSSSDILTPETGGIVANGDGTFSLFGSHLYSTAIQAVPFSITIDDEGGAKISARAADLVVNTTSDSPIHLGTSLRDAIEQSAYDATQGTWDTILFDTAVFAAPTTIVLEQGPLEFPSGPVPITIDGESRVAISGGGTGGVFKVDIGALASLSGITIENGRGSGGGIMNYGVLTVTDCTFSGDSTSIGGGAIFNLGALTVSNSTFTNNNSQDGGAIFNLPNGSVNATLTVSNSTFTNNSADDAGAIFIAGGTVAVADCTISGNSATGFAGGIDNQGTLILSNTIVAGNAGGPDIAGSFTDSGFNLFGAEVNNGQLSPTDRFTDYPQLLPLGNYGGATQTMALQIAIINQAIQGGGPITAVTTLAPAGSTRLQIANGATIALTPGTDSIVVGGESLGVSQVKGNTVFLSNETTSTIAPGESVFPATDQRGVGRNPDSFDIGAFEAQPSNLATSDSDSPGHTGVSLRDAVNLAMAESLSSGTMQTVTIASDISSIILTSPIVVNGGTISLASEGPVTIDGHDATKLFEIGPGANVTLGSGSTIDTRLTFQNADPPFGAISNAGNLIVSNSDFYHNYAEVSGGAIYNTGSLLVSNSSFEFNAAGVSGGAIENDGGSLIVSGSTFDDNRGGIDRGSIDNHAGVASISDTTITDLFIPLGGGLLNEASLILGYNNDIDSFTESADSGPLIIDDRVNSIGVSYSITASTIQVEGSAAITYTGASSLTIEGDSGTDTYNVQGTTAATPVTLITGTGVNLVNVAPQDQDLTDIQGGLAIDGGGRTTAVLDDQDDLIPILLQLPNACTVTSSAVENSFGATISYSGLSSLTINGDLYADYYDVNSTAAGTPVIINNGPGFNTVNVSPSDRDLTNIQGGLTIHGGGSTAAIFDDQNDITPILFGLPNLYSVTSSNVENLFSAVISYSGLSELTLNGDRSDDTYEVEGTAAGTPLTINSGIGNNTVNVTPTSENLANLRGSLVIQESLGGQAAVTIGDTADTVKATYTITPTSLQTNVSAPITYAGATRLTVEGGGNGNTFDVQGIGAGTAVTLDTGTGDDAVTVGDSLQTYDELLGSLTVNGQAGNNTLTFNDQGQSQGVSTHTANDVWLADQVAIYWVGAGDVSGSTTVTFDNIQQTVLNDVSGPTTAEHIIYEPSLNTHLTINGHPTNDIIVSVITSGQTLTDTVTGHYSGTIGENVTFSGVYFVTTSGRGSVTYKYEPGGFMSAYVVDGGTGILDLSDLNPGVSVYLDPTPNEYLSSTSHVPGVVVGFGGISNILGSGGSDTLIGADGAANSWSLTGADSGQVDGFTFSKFENLRGGSGADTFALSDGGTESGSIDGGGGVNTLDYSTSIGDVTVDLPLGTASRVGGGVQNIRNVVGSQGDDILVGNGTGNTLDGGTDRNLLIAGGGPGTLVGGPDDDILVGGSTDYDSNPAALIAIMAEWDRTDLDGPGDPTGYQARVGHLLNGGGLNGTSLLNGSTFHSNGGGNTLTGAAGLDLFFGRVALDENDWNASLGELFVDAGAPTSSVSALPAFSPGHFTVRWSGTDVAGPGIIGYSVYVSDNNAAFTPWLIDTAQTSATYIGVNGHTYGFYSVATDAAGTRQTTPASAQATTRVDATPPTSHVSPLPARGISLSFAVSVTGSDLDAADGGPASGVASYAIYVSIDGGTWTQWTTVPASSPTANYTGQSNNSYSFFSLATDIAGNIENKAPLIEASTYLPDLTPPVTTVDATTATNPSTVDRTTGTFTLDLTGSDPGGAALVDFEVFVSIDGGSYQEVGPYAIPAGFADSHGTYHSTIAYQGLTDGQSHTYSFYSIGLDSAGNLQGAPKSPNVTFASQDFTLAKPSQLQVTSFTVEHGSPSRSFIQYLDLGFDESDAQSSSELTNIVNSIGTASPDIVIYKYDLNGDASSKVAVPLSSPTMLSVIDHAIEINFGSGGIGNSPTTTTPDGYYEVDIKLPSGQTAVHHFDRLLGDVAGDGIVNQNDLNEIAASIGESTQVGWAPLSTAVTGDGTVSSLDLLLATRSKNRKLETGLSLG